MMYVTTIKNTVNPRLCLISNTFRIPIVFAFIFVILQWKDMVNATTNIRAFDNMVLIEVRIMLAFSLYIRPTVRHRFPFRMIELERYPRGPSANWKFHTQR